MLFLYNHIIFKMSSIILSRPSSGVTYKEAGFLDWTLDLLDTDYKSYDCNSQWRYRHSQLQSI
jgi:hypothetical protein